MELDGVSRERHDEILVHSRMSDREREVRASDFCTNRLLRKCEIVAVVSEDTQ
jgi:hypothetical protein